MKFVIRTTNEYERLVQFFVKNGLEFDGDEEVDTDIHQVLEDQPGSAGGFDPY